MRYFRMDSFASNEIDALARSFANAKPFPHVVIPDALRIAPQEVLPHFPSADSDLWRHMNESYQKGKMTLSEIEYIPEPLASMVRELMEPPMLEWLERITGIEGLLTDPYLQGGGLHCSGPGGVMAPHTDSHVNQRLGLYKRVNLLAYLNPDWEEPHGGSFELYDPSDLLTPVRHVIPRWGTVVLFRSDARSIHGFSKPIVGPHRIRRAIAMYYYTTTDATDFSGYDLTHWWHHDPYWTREGMSPLLRAARMQVYRTLRFSSKALAYLAQRAGPRAGSTR